MLRIFELVTAAVRIAETFIGVNAVTPEEARRRIGICATNRCGHFGGQPGQPYCRNCGCPLTFKVTNRKNHCPIGEW